MVDTRGLPVKKKGDLDPALPAIEPSASCPLDGKKPTCPEGILARFGKKIPFDGAVFHCELSE